MNAVMGLVQSGFEKNPFFATRSDVLVYGHVRRKQLKDGKWWDLQFDPIYDGLDIEYVHLEKNHNGTHYSPPKTESVYYRDFVYNIARLWRKWGTGLDGIDERELKDVDRIERILNDTFDTDLSITNDVYNELSLRQSLLPLYRQVLRRIEPRVVFISVSYGRETFIEACQRERIPVVEFQHGVIHDTHLGYSYPGQRAKRMSPDYLLLWGKFWKDSVEYPLPDERIVPVGYPYLERTARQYENVLSKDQVVFVSQWTIGDQLSKFAVELDQHPSVDSDIVYKLHPREYDDWQTRYPWLVDGSLEVLGDSDRQLYDLFAESTAQVGVHSTAIYEGLYFGLDTVLYDCSGVEMLQPLLDNGYATLVGSVEEFVKAQGNSETTFDRQYFFAPDPLSNISEFLSTIDIPREGN